MIDLHKYPIDIQQKVAQFAGAARAWAKVAIEPLDDVKHAIIVSVLDGKDPARDVPRQLKIRRLPSGDWVARDPVQHARGCDLDDDSIPGEAIDPPKPPQNDADGIYEIMKRDGIGRRAAQIRVKNQLVDLQHQGDLFIIGGV